MDDNKILGVVVVNLHFLDSLNNLPISLNGMPKSFDLTRKNVYYPHFFNTSNNWCYVGSFPEPKYYGTDFGDDRVQFSAWYAWEKQIF
jgi:hypothetical protein